MRKDPISENPQDLIDAIDKYTSAVIGKEATYGTTAQAVQILVNMRNTLALNYKARNDGRTALEVAQDVLETQQNATTVSFRSLRNKGATSDATPAQKDAAGITVRAKPTRSLPHTPLKVVATPDLSGHVALSWDRAGNKSGTDFIVEEQVTPGTWSIATFGKVVKAKVPCPVGRHTRYRLIARNGEGDSDPSQEVEVYGN